MILVDEYLAVLVISGSRPDSLGDDAVALTYGRAYRLTRALMDVGPGRLQVKGRFTRLVEGLSRPGQRLSAEWLADPEPAVLSIIDPPPLIGATAALQNTYALSYCRRRRSPLPPIRMSPSASAIPTVPPWQCAAWPGNLASTSPCSWPDGWLQPAFSPDCSSVAATSGPKRALAMASVAAFFSPPRRWP